MTREPTIPDDVAPRTGDLAVVQALAATRATARERAEEEGRDGDGRWRSIADRADHVLASLGLDSPEVGHTPAIGFDRIDRDALGLDAPAAARLAATLHALHDRPDDARIDAADQALADLGDQLG
jgi:hypothetical protein